MITLLVPVICAAQPPPYHLMTTMPVPPTLVVPSMAANTKKYTVMTTMNAQLMFVTQHWDARNVYNNICLIGRGIDEFHSVHIHIESNSGHIPYLPKTTIGVP